MNPKSVRYCESVCYLYGLPDWTGRVLYFCLLLMTMGRDFHISVQYKKEVCKKYSIPVTQFNQGLTLLVKSGILVRKNVSYYKIEDERRLPQMDWMRKTPESLPL